MKIQVKHHRIAFSLVLFSLLIVCSIELFAQRPTLKRRQPEPNVSTTLQPNTANNSSQSDYSKLTVIKVFSGEFSGTIEDIAFSPDGNSLVTGGGKVIATGDDKTVRLWDVQSGKMKTADFFKVI